MTGDEMRAMLDAAALLKNTCDQQAFCHGNCPFYAGVLGCALQERLPFDWELDRAEAYANTFKAEVKTDED